jgi:hypothetical protein
VAVVRSSPARIAVVSSRTPDTKSDPSFAIRHQTEGFDSEGLRGAENDLRAGLVSLTTYMTMSRTRTKPRVESRLVLCASCGGVLERRQAITTGQRIDCFFCIIGSTLSAIDHARNGARASS